MENPQCFAPAVSVIIPVYNAEKFLAHSLESVLAQTLLDIEILCTDDGSTDASPEILRKFAESDSRIRIFTQKNARQGAARNLALGNARGEYVAFLDSDDSFAPDALEKLRDAAAAERLDMLMLSAVRTDERGRERAFGYHDFSRFIPPAFPRKCFSARDLPPKLFWRMPCSCWGTFYRRAFIEKCALRFPEKIYFEDRPFFFDALAAAERIGILDEKLYRYRIHPHSTMAAQTRFFADYIAQGKITLERVRERGVSEAVENAGIVEHAHGLLKLLAISPLETLRASRRETVSEFAALFPPEKRAALLEQSGVLDRACSRVILGEASARDRAAIRRAALKYAILRRILFGARRERYREKSALAQKIFLFNGRN